MKNERKFNRTENKGRGNAKAQVSEQPHDLRNLRSAPSLRGGRDLKGFQTTEDSWLFAAFELPYHLRIGFSWHPIAFMLSVAHLRKIQSTRVQLHPSAAREFLLFWLDISFV